MEQTTKSEKLRAFIEASKAKGAADDFLVSLLREQGWGPQSETGMAYELYAQFSTDSAVANRCLPHEVSWHHPKGRYCFELNASQFPDY